MLFVVVVDCKLSYGCCVGAVLCCPSLSAVCCLVLYVCPFFSKKNLLRMLLCVCGLLLLLFVVVC